MADNEHPPPPDQAAGPNPDDPGAEREGSGVPGPPAIRDTGDPAPARPPAASPPQLDPEQLRQFQEFQQFQQFQQFQEFQRRQQQGGQQALPAASPNDQLVPARTRGTLVRRWGRKVGGKLLSMIVVVVLLLVGGVFAIDYFLGGSNDDGGNRLRPDNLGTDDNLRYATDPYGQVQKVYLHVAQNASEQAAQVCQRFTDDGRAQFAANLGYSDCPGAVRGMHEQVTDPTDYSRSMPRDTPSDVEVAGTSVRISSCQDSRSGVIEGGPALGVFIVELDEGSRDDQWIITGHESEPDTCTAPTTGTP